MNFLQRVEQATGMQGGREALKYAYRDLPHLDETIALTRRQRVAVQAGGNLGVYPKHLAERFETVYCFEPSAELFPLLVANAPEPNIVKLQAAVGCERRLVGTSRERRDGRPNNHEGITHVAGTGHIPTLTVDDLGLPVCDLLALDVEGYELYALQGAAQTLARCRPVVCVEINKSLGFLGLNPEDVRSFLRGLDYQFVMRLSSDETFVPAEWERQ
jgi:FkbM family methyltransferase